MNQLQFNSGQLMFKGSSFIGQYVGFNMQKQKNVTFDGALGKYRDFDIGSVSPKITKD
jgi:hypothetical protein